jgi:hypothetical protein
MPGFCFDSEDKQISLLDKVVIQGEVLTMYFNSKLASVLSNHIKADVLMFVQRTDRNQKPYTFIYEDNKDHDALHTDFPSEERMHHHIKHSSNVTIGDIMHLIFMHQSLVSDFTKNRNDGIRFLSKNDLIKLYCDFELYVKFSATKSSKDHLEIHFKSPLSAEAYLPRLKYILDTADDSETKIIKVNKDKTIYYLPYFWLKDIGNAKKELAQNLYLKEEVFSPAMKK